MTALCVPAFFPIQGTRPERLYVPTEDDVLTVRKIRSFQDLAPGWNYGRGRPASGPTAKMAMSIYRLFVQLGFNATDAFPGDDGEIMVTAYKDNHYLECLVAPDNTLSFVYEVDDLEQKSIDRLSQTEALREINLIAGEIWNTSNLCNPRSTMLEEIGSKA